MIETNFKHTDIGLIPHDWEVKELEPLCSKLCVGFVGTCEPYYVSAGRGVKMVRTGDLKDSYVDLSNTKFISYDFHRSHLKSQLKRGDILIARHGSNGHGVIYDSDAEANSLNIVILRTESISNKYIIYLLDSPSLRLQIEGVTAGSTQRVINTKEIAKLQIPLPPTLAEQAKIADALSKIDKLISEMGALIEKKKAIKQGTMQELLTAKRRLKGFTGEWIEKTIEELGILTGAGVDKKSSEDETPIRLVNYLDVFKRDYIFQKELDFWVTANEGKKHQCNVLKGDIFFTPSSEMPYDIALSALAMEDMPNVCYSYHIYRLRLNEDIDFLYRAYMFKSDSFYSQANQTCEGSGKRYVISLSKFKQMTVTYPSSKKEQRAIANVLSSMDTEITNLEQKRNKYIAIKQGMMQNLLTGKIRLI